MKNMFIAIALAIGMSEAAHSQSYELVMLDSSGSETCAFGINEYGFSCGYKTVNGTPTPCIWAPNGEFLMLGSTPTSANMAGVAYSIDEYFDVVGQYGRVENKPYPFHGGYAVGWTIDQSYNLVPFDIGSSGQARDINNNGEMAGHLNDTAHIENVIFGGLNYNFYSQYSYCSSINEDGNATGGWISNLYPVQYSPQYYKKNAAGGYDVTTGTEVSQLYGNCFGTGINASNCIVGISVDQGVYWEPESGYSKSFGSGTQCYDINDGGTIVGTSNSLAYAWLRQPDKSFVAIDLNSYRSSTNIVLEEANRINNKGQIVGQALNLSTGVRSAFLLTPSKTVGVRLEKATNGLSLAWNSMDGHYYSIHTSTDLKTWTHLPDQYLAYGTNSWTTVIPDQEKMFFMVFDLTP